MHKKSDIFINFLKRNNLKITSQRSIILEIFLKSNQHLSVDDLYDILKKRNSGIGQATVFRTLKLFCQAEIAKEVDFGDKKVRYEHKFNNNNHDHLVCIKCGKFIEAVEPRIERLQSTLCKKFDFLPQKHKTEIFGICSGCRNSKQ